MEIEIPSIETERLLLRPFHEDDTDPLFELLQDPEVVRYIGDPANTASVAVATKLGDTLRRETDLLGNRVQVYAISRAEWAGRQ